MTAYRYFVSYAHGRNGAFGFGHAEISLPAPITGITDLTQVVTILRSQGAANPVVLHFARFDTRDTVSNGDLS